MLYKKDIWNVSQYSQFHFYLIFCSSDCFSNFCTKYKRNKKIFSCKPSKVMHALIRILKSKIFLSIKIFSLNFMKFIHLQFFCDSSNVKIWNYKSVTMFMKPVQLIREICLVKLLKICKMYLVSDFTTLQQSSFPKIFDHHSGKKKKKKKKKKIFFFFF